MGKQHWSQVKPLLCSFFPMAWLGHLGLGLAYGFMGPAQPYLASQVGVGHQEISLMWTARSVGIVLACMTSGQIFGSSWMAPKRLLFLASAPLLAAMCLYMIPFVQEFVLLLALVCVMAFGLGSFDVADNGLMNMMLGPESSRPLVQSLHAFVAIGFVLIAFIMPQMLPQESPGSTEELCAKLKNPDLFPALQDLNSTEIVEWPILAFPSILVGLWLFLVAIGFVILAVKGVQLPTFHSMALVEASTEKAPAVGVPTSKGSKCHETTLLCLGVVFFFLAGVESCFHSQTYTFGLCGPLKLSSATAGYLNGIFFAPYLAGRLISIPLSTVITPTAITLVTIIGCFISALILLIFGSTDTLSLFIATGMMGFFSSFLFGSGITWMNSSIEGMTSRQLSFIYVGANLASCIFPALSSKLFNDVAPEAIFHLTLACVVALFVCFCAMILVSRLSAKTSSITESATMIKA